MGVRLLNKLLLLCLISTPVLANERFEAGREVYLSYGCAVCHGKDGKGDGVNAKNSNPPPTNFHDTKAYRRGSDKRSMLFSIKYGIKGEINSMPAFKDIDDKELQELLKFLLSLQDIKQD